MAGMNTIKSIGAHWNTFLIVTTFSRNKGAVKKYPSTPRNNTPTMYATAELKYPASSFLNIVLIFCILKIIFYK
jgi:hypothetical protein